MEDEVTEVDIADLARVLERVARAIAAESRGKRAQGREDGGCCEGMNKDEIGQSSTRNALKPYLLAFRSALSGTVADQVTVAVGRHTSHSVLSQPAGQCHRN